MPLPQTLEMTCDKCKVAETCPAKGASPLLIGGKMAAKCQLVGGYGRNPVDRDVLGVEARVASDRDGPCLTLAQVPRVEDGHLVRELIKVFSKPVRHGRETVDPTASNIYPRLK